MRGKPRNKRYKEKFRNDTKNQTSESLVESKMTYDGYNPQAPLQENETKPNDENKKDTPIFEESDLSSMTFFELKEFIEEQVSPHANYQFVMLKLMISRKTAHKGEIAEDLAIFNGVNPADFQQTKKFLTVPVYNVLTKHGFVKEINHYGKLHYILNVKLGEFEELELSHILENKIKEWNDSHGISEFQFDYDMVMSTTAIDWNKKEFEQAIAHQNAENTSVKDYTKKYGMLKTNPKRTEDVDEIKKQLEELKAQLKHQSKKPDTVNKLMETEIHEQVEHLQKSINGLQERIDRLSRIKFGMQRKLQELEKNMRLRKND